MLVGTVLQDGCRHSQHCHHSAGGEGQIRLGLRLIIAQRQVRPGLEQLIKQRVKVVEERDPMMKVALRGPHTSTSAPCCADLQPTRRDSTHLFVAPGKSFQNAGKVRNRRPQHSVHETAYWCRLQHHSARSDAASCSNIGNGMVATTGGRTTSTDFLTFTWHIFRTGQLALPLEWPDNRAGGLPGPYRVFFCLGVFLARCSGSGNKTLHINAHGMSAAGMARSCCYIQAHYEAPPPEASTQWAL